MNIPPTIRGKAGRTRRAVNRRRYGVERALLWGDTTHLVPRPVFVLSSTRSGSTLLRSILNSHPAICAPHEMHLATMRVSTDKGYAEDSWATLGLSMRDMENLLWDRMLHLQLVRSGKKIIVDKTPQNVSTWTRIHDYWPQARYIHLRRHPAMVLESLQRVHVGRSRETDVAHVLEYARQQDEARAALPGPTVTYEDITTDPEATMRTICSYLGVRYQSRMLSYRSNNSRAGLGDWSERIRSGRVQQHDPLPAANDVPPPLRELAQRWGY